MQPLSVVIIAKNEAHIIGRTLQSIQQLTDNIIVCDTGSTDATIPIAQLNGAKVIEHKWEGYGETKNLANEYAAYDWILQLDADEVPDQILLTSLHQLDLKDESIVYAVIRKNYYAGRHLRYGQWQNDKCMRLFNRKVAQWSKDLVHEKLLYSDSVKTVLLKGFIYHYTYETTEEHFEKIKKYSLLGASTLYAQKKKPSFIKQYISPVAGFIINYFLKLGFLDGYYGFKVAWLNSYCTYVKYKKLRNLYKR